MFVGTEFQKWCALVLLALIGGGVAYKFPYPSDPIRPYLAILATLLFAKNWLEYLLCLPIIGLKGVCIPTHEHSKRLKFTLFTVAAYVGLAVFVFVPGLKT